jgi:hypothetical protein
METNMKTIENEYRVRAVTRYVVTHFMSTDKPGSGTSVQYGEFPNIDQADVVGRALNEANPGSTFVTIEERREPRAIVYAYTDEQVGKLMDFTFSQPDESASAPPDHAPPQAA